MRNGGESADQKQATEITTSPLPVAPEVVAQIISGDCSKNDQQDAIFFSQVPNALPDSVQLSTPDSLKPFWDVRYTNSITPLIGVYANHLPYSGLDANTSIQNTGYLTEGQSTAWGTIASVSDPQGVMVQTACVNGQLVESSTLNGYDSQPVNTFGGPQETFHYTFGKYGNENSAQPAPWANGGNLMIQGYFMRPYQSDATQVGAQQNIIIYLTNPKIPGSLINYVISLSRSNGDLTENGISGDPTTGAIVVSTLIQEGTKFVTKSQYSATTTNMPSILAASQGWPNFYRVNISLADLQFALSSLKASAIASSNPMDWTLLDVSVQTEITGSMSQVVGTGVSGFSVYETTAPM